MAPSVTAPVFFEVDPGKGPVELRFNVTSALAFEKRAGGSPAMLIMRTQLVEANILMLCYALQHRDLKMTEQKATALYQRFIDGGGNANELREALLKAVAASGVYGRNEETTDEPDEDAVADPLATTTANA